MGGAVSISYDPWSRVLLLVQATYHYPVPCTAVGRLKGKRKSLDARNQSRRPQKSWSTRKLRLRGLEGQHEREPNGGFSGPKGCAPAASDLFLGSLTGLGEAQLVGGGSRCNGILTHPHAARLIERTIFMTIQPC